MNKEIVSGFSVFVNEYRKDFGTVPNDEIIKPGPRSK